MNAISRSKPERMALAVLLGVALTAHLLWLARTNFSEEDSFIVFRFARNLAGGLGFVFNPGERVYGSTTPLYTFLLAFWYRFIGADFTVAARLLCIGATLGCLAVLWSILRWVQLPLPARFPLLILLGISSKTCLMDTQGLESPFVILFMMISWYFYITEKPIGAGLFAGLMLWVRIDTALWPVALAIAACPKNFRGGLKLLAAAGLVYLPWLAFAWLYFGSPIPLTVLAKWAATAIPVISVPTHLVLMIGYLSPLDFGPISIFPADKLPALLTGFFTLFFAAWFGFSSVRKRWLLGPLIFIVVEIVRLSDVRSPIDYRYYYPLLWLVWILFFLGAFSLWEKVRQYGSLSVWIPRALVLLLAAAVLIRGGRAARIARDYQVYRNEASLKEVGLWLKANTPEDAAILLEPLGYIGYYSERSLSDEVGLVTPQAIALRLQGVPTALYYQHVNPDFVVVHCDYPSSMRNIPGAEEDFLDRYRLVARMDPLGYESGLAPPQADSVTPWTACYAVWERR